MQVFILDIVSAENRDTKRYAETVLKAITAESSPSNDTFLTALIKQGDILYRQHKDPLILIAKMAAESQQQANVESEMKMHSSYNNGEEQDEVSTLKGNYSKKDQSEASEDSTEDSMDDSIEEYVMIIIHL